METRSDPSARPNGIDVQAFDRLLLGKAHAYATLPEQREHITPALIEHSRLSGIVSMIEGLWLDHLPYFRMTVDTPDDLASMQAIYEHCSPEPSLNEIISVHDNHPELFLTK